mmetsp:Transcript_29595/g.78359  ORF Transcript_29595/g.78359 Transcript_29595/m.78359 type:complete len:205 (-) Transcript_29595:666-1280(-)
MAKASSSEMSRRSPPRPPRPRRPSNAALTGSVPRTWHRARQKVVHIFPRKNGSWDALIFARSSDTASFTVGQSYTKVIGIGAFTSAWMCLIRSTPAMESTPMSTNTSDSRTSCFLVSRSTSSPMPGTTPSPGAIACVTCAGPAPPSPTLPIAARASSARPSASRAMAFRYQAFGSSPSMASAADAAPRAVRLICSFSAAAALFL